MKIFWFVYASNIKMFQWECFRIFCIIHLWKITILGVEVATKAGINCQQKKIFKEYSSWSEVAQNFEFLTIDGHWRRKIPCFVYTRSVCSYVFCIPFITACFMYREKIFLPSYWLEINLSMNNKVGVINKEIYLKPKT